MTTKPIICPKCGRLIGSSESSCSWCGTSRPPAWLARFGSRGALNGEWLIKTVITVNVAFYIITLLVSSRDGGGLLGALSPDRSALLFLGATGTVPVAELGRTWSLITANYLHGGILHILFNMMALRQLAPLVNLEYGTNRMFVIYTLGGVFGFWISCLAGVPFTIGASAAVCSLIGSLLYFGKSRGGTYGAAVFRDVSGWIAGLAIFGFLVPGINNWGHGGGIAGGIILGMVLKYKERGQETVLHRILALACALVTAGALGWALITGILFRFGSS
ncbi:MAG: rhomboid family intramembrane serine protease [Deltaproteobacteria bacterium]|nr:rhomboid family intramembrane serine protease [Deltaproteobacteria bacterium]TLN04139.1 MAG: rhomboid family intramembrane serine protease [bacterium]